MRPSKRFRKDVKNSTLLQRPSICPLALIDTERLYPSVLLYVNKTDENDALKIKLSKNGAVGLVARGKYGIL